MLNRISFLLKAIWPVGWPQEGLWLVGPQPTREGFLQALKVAGTIDIAGFKLTYGPDDNQGSDQVIPDSY